MMQVFFSVCIPLYNREKTIYKTLCSLSNQLFKDFNVKIVIYNCTDSTIDQVKLFFNSNYFRENPFDYEIKYDALDYDDWNGPILIADGKYIAMLEGDDQFLPEHLKQAHSYLVNNTNVGVYCTGNQHGPREIFGLIKSTTFFKFIFSMKAVPPPSETIFIRLDSSFNSFLYDHKSFLYAPEINLYLDIASQGFDAYYDSFQNVWRHPSSYKQRKWMYFHDSFRIISIHKNNSIIGTKLLTETQKLIALRTVGSYIVGLIKGEIIEPTFKKQIISEIGQIRFYYFVIYFVIVKTISIIKEKISINV